MFLTVAVVWDPVPDTAWHRLAGEVWLLLVVASGLLAGYEAYFRHRLVDEIAGIAGPGIVETLLPQQVLSTLLRSIYGEKDANREVVAGVLGGEGRRPHGLDLTISSHTVVELSLDGIDSDTYRLTTAVSYSFKENVLADRFVIFATCSALLRDSITSGCQLPLFDLWFIPDEQTFQESVEDMLPSVEMSFSYLDTDGSRRTVGSTKIRPRDVRVDRWREYLQFFREGTAWLPRLRTGDHQNDLRIFECDLRDIAANGHSMEAIERLTLRATARQKTDDGFCYWQAPYPCYVETISMNISRLDPSGSNSWQFRVMPFTFRSNTGSARWLPADRIGALDVRSWLLPGHGVALLWRPANHGGSPNNVGPSTGS